MVSIKLNVIPAGQPDSGPSNSGQFQLRTVPATQKAVFGWRLPRLVWSALTGIVLAAGCSELSNSTYEMELANHLTSTDAKMYGAYWCPHCATQKDLFKGAANQLPYVECDPNGVDAQPDLCQAKAIRGYPTWEINGEFYEGARSPGNLAQLAGFAPPPEADRGFVERFLLNESSPAQQ